MDHDENNPVVEDFSPFTKLDWTLVVDVSSLKSRI